MNAKRGRSRLVPDEAEAAGSNVIVRMAVAAALGFALSACGQGAGSSSAAASTAQSTTAAQSSISDPSSTPAQSPTPDPSSTSEPSSTPTQDPAPSQSPPAGGSPPAGSASTGSSPPAASPGNVTINWTPPSQNMDGTPLTNLAGYDIHYGMARGRYTQTITLSNPGITRYVVANLAPGTYYFAVAAVNSAGTESPLSSEVSATVD